jgi:PEP-CTERM motif
MTGSLAPDWERIGTDVTHQGPFNAAFSLSGDVIPEPSTLLLFGIGLLGLGDWGRKHLFKH